MQTTAVILDGPGTITLGSLALDAPRAGDVVVEIETSGISTGTERLLWNGTMPPFPGMGYPLVPGYEAFGRVAEAARGTGLRPGDAVFVPGASCYGPVRGLFGGSARRIVTKAERVLKLDPGLGEAGVLVALAATARHALAGLGRALPELIVGHGVLGRLLARLTLAAGGPPPVVWEADPVRQRGAEGYAVTTEAEDPRRDYASIYDVTGDAALLDRLVARLARGGEIVLAGFYAAPLSFAFPPAFMREARIRIAAEWTRADLLAIRELVEAGALPLDGLVTHRRPAAEAAEAYAQAFGEPACLKMVLDWKGAA